MYRWYTYCSELNFWILTFWYFQRTLVQYRSRFSAIQWFYRAAPKNITGGHFHLSPSTFLNPRRESNRLALGPCISLWVVMPTVRMRLYNVVIFWSTMHIFGHISFWGVIKYFWFWFWRTESFVGWGAWRKPPSQLFQKLSDSVLQLSSSSAKQRVTKALGCSSLATVACIK